jgi:hypothetical protein
MFIIFATKLRCINHEVPRHEISKVGSSNVLSKPTLTTLGPINMWVAQNNVLRL